ncbi:MAG: ribosome recycling factor [Dehalococcoidia bacterium]|nr:ribosome recycling factor [Dehalococcoidia bacterium]
MIEDVLSDAESRMHKAIESLQRDLATIRTGRASPGLVEKIPVDYYGAPTPIIQLGQVTAPEPRVVTILPYDRNAMPMIEKAIQKSDLGLTPTNDGRVIRLVFPALTRERRIEMTKIVKKVVEDHKVAIRNIRRDANEMLKELEKNKEISADEEKRAQDRLQKLTDQQIAEADRIGRAKEAEVLEV